ncbi:MaoC/PaaZ C-terminal domain-containing protein [Spirillospora sp. CA-255316]
MPLDLDAVGFRAEPFTVSWSAQDAILYALGVGAGQLDALDELHLTTQNTSGVEQQVLPTFGVVLAQSGLLRRIPIGEFDRTALLHADQRVEVHSPIPADGSAVVEARLDGIHDKGSGALVRIAADVRETGTGKALCTTRLGYFVRGEGGFGGQPAPPEAWREPAGEADLGLVTPTRPDQALLYRLSGDFNPLHSDPSFAAKAGFERPILHGLCTYGVVSRALIRELGGGDCASVQSIYARFSRPVLPGEELRTAVWRDEAGIRFRTTDGQGRTVLDRGRLQFR